MFPPLSLAMYHWPPSLVQTVVTLSEVIDFAEEESVYVVIFVLQFLMSSSIVDFTFNASIVARLIAYSSASQLDKAIVV